MVLMKPALLTLLLASVHCQESTTPSVAKDQAVNETKQTAEKKQDNVGAADAGDETSKNKRGLHLGYGYGEHSNNFFNGGGWEGATSFSEHYQTHDHHQPQHHEKHTHTHTHEIKTITKKVPVPYPVTKYVPYPVEKKVPYPVHVEKKVPVIVEKKVPYPVDRPYPVHKYIPYPVEKKVPYPVHVEKKVHVPYPVEKLVPYPVEKKVPYPVHVEKKVPVPYPVEKLVPYPVTVEKQVPVPYQVTVEKKVPYPVHIKVPVEKPVPYPVTVEKPVPYPVHVEKKVPVYVPVPVHKHQEHYQHEGQEQEENAYRQVEGAQVTEEEGQGEEQHFDHGDYASGDIQGQYESQKKENFQKPSEKSLDTKEQQQQGPAQPATAPQEKTDKSPEPRSIAKENTQ